MASIITAGNSTNLGYTVSSDTTGIMQIATGSGAGTTAMTINGSQNVGIGTSSPSYKFQVGQNATINTSALSSSTFSAFLGTTSNSASTSLGFQTTNANGYQGYAAITCVPTADYRCGLVATYTADQYGTGYFAINRFDASGSTSEVLRTDASSNLLVGTTSANNNNSSSFAFNVANGNQYCNHINGTSSGTGYIQFSYNGTVIGTITQNGTTGVLYNLTSDYRLKSNPTKITNGVATINQLNPVTFTWTSDNTQDSGFIAHEFQSVLPRSVTGEKDAVDADGKPVYQGMDNSGAVPYLVAAIQELSAQVTAQAALLKAAGIAGF